MDSASSRILVKPVVDKGWVWVYAFAAFMLRFIYDGFLFSIGVFHESLYEYFGASSAATSLVASILLGMAFITAPFATCLVNRFDCRRVSLSGALIATSGLLLSLAVPQIEYLYITIGLFCGCGVGLMDFSAVAIIGAHFDKKRATAMGLSFSGSGFGSLLFAPLMGWLNRYYGSWKGSMLIASGLLLNCVVFSLFYNEQGLEEKKESETRVEVLQSVDAIPIISIDSKEELKPSTSTENASIVFQTTDDILTTDEDILTTDNDFLVQDSNMQIKNTLAQKNAVQATASAVAFHEQSRCIRFTDAIQNLIDLSVFSQYVYLLFNLATCIFSLGIRMPFVYISHRATELGIATPYEASFFISIIGVSNTLGRLMFGAWADKTTIRRLNIFNAALMVNGLSNFATSLFTQYYQMAIYCLVFGVTFGGITILTPVVLVDLLGVQKLNTCYGLLGFTAGIAITCGTPLTGMIYDKTHSYQYGFYVSGGIITASCFLLFLIPIVQKRYPQ